MTRAATSPSSVDAGVLSSPIAKQWREVSASTKCEADGGGPFARSHAPSVSAREGRAPPPPAAPLRCAGEERKRAASACAEMEPPRMRSAAEAYKFTLAKSV